MLVYCIECESRVSDKAPSCPSCGIIFSKKTKEKEKLFKMQAEKILKRVKKEQAEEDAELKKNLDYIDDFCKEEKAKHGSVSSKKWWEI